MKQIDIRTRVGVLEGVKTEILGIMVPSGYNAKTLKWLRDQVIEVIDKKIEDVKKGYRKS